MKVGHTGNENRSHFVGGYVGRWVGTCVQLTLTLKLGHVENESRSHFVGGCVGWWVHVCS